MNIINKMFWKRAVRHEMLSIAKIASLVAGLLLIISGLLYGPLVLGLLLGIGIIILSGRLKHRIFSAVFLAAGILTFSSFVGFGEWGIILLVVASALGLASTFL
jgi:hypothetical protein